MTPTPNANNEPATAAFNPTAFGKYYLIDRIAVGGMAEIFRAKTFGHGGFEKQVVIKRILSHLSGNDQFVQMFMDEAKVSALLQHANIVGIYDFGRFRDNYFIAMEQVEGRDVKLILRKLSERRKLLPPEFAVYIAMEAAKGLDHAHKKTTLQGVALNIVHRDVSPSNILVSWSGEVKVADFGIVKAANVADDAHAGVLKGKFEYMSPEQASARELDRRSDVFSLGIILWEMLTGRRLFKTDSDVRTLDRIKAGDVDPPSTQNNAVNARLDAIVMRALARDPDERYQDARELYADLLDFLYPASPDLTQSSLAHFIQEQFADEISVERQRIEDGTRVALAMHAAEQEQEDVEPVWDESATRGDGPAPSPSPAATRSPTGPPMLVAVVAVGLLAAITVTWFTMAEGPADVPPVASAPAFGTIHVRLQSVGGEPLEGRVTVDGKEVGQGSEIVVPDVAAGVEHILRAEVKGWAPYEERVSLAAGERLRLGVTLGTTTSTANAPRPPDATQGAAQGATAPAPRPAPPPAPAATEPGTVAFESTPPGAEVYVDGRSIGRTPVSWDGRAGERHPAELRLTGFETAKFNITVPASGARDTYQRTLQAQARVAAADGKLSVNVSGGWADVYIDGKKIKQTPLFDHTVPAGTYEVRVRNDVTGLDQGRKVTVKSGETERVTFSAE